MVGYRKAFDIVSKLKTYEVGIFSNFDSYLNYLQNFDLVIIDNNLKSYFGSGSSKYSYINCIEETKSWNGLPPILDLLIQYKINRRSRVMVIGGGVLQDACSFCLSIFNRGIEFEFTPTTLLAMVDSCVGGKTSINYFDYKNKIGNYFPPNKIHIIPEFQKTLSNTEMFSGMGEIFKFMVLQGKFVSANELKQNNNLINEELILDCLRYKKSIIETDEFDNGERLKLNYGHTFGHAIEAVSKYQIPHGIGVVFGICVANQIAENKGVLSSEIRDQIEQNAKSFIDKIDWNPEWFNFKKLLTKILMDKKNTNQINMILLSEEASNYKLQDVDQSILENSLNETLKRLNLAYA
jgi:3-dehydroquinate synthase